VRGYQLRHLSIILNFQSNEPDDYFFGLASFLGSGFFAVFAGAVLAGLSALVLAGLAGAFAGAFVETFVPGGTVRAEFASVVLAAEFASTLAFGFTAGASVVASGLVDNTETPPVRAGIESIRADNIKMVAATIVVFDKTVAVPRDP
jgi:hypothetical protein